MAVSRRHHACILFPVPGGPCLRQIIFQNFPLALCGLECRGSNSQLDDRTA
jgi:hypothetical protein